jgi:FXSXX-COOH protein
MCEQISPAGGDQVEQSSEIESDLVDVNDLSLDQLAALPDTVLRTALRRALAAPDAEAEQFAMHQVSF